MYKILKTTYFYKDGRKPFADTKLIEIDNISKYRQKLKVDNPDAIGIEFTYATIE